MTWIFLAIMPMANCIYNWPQVFVALALLEWGWFNCLERGGWHDESKIIEVIRLNIVLHTSADPLWLSNQHTGRHQ